MVDKIIQLVTEQLSSLPCIEGIVLGGSRARGNHREDSDIDIGLYYNPDLLDIAAINQLASELDDEHRSNLVGSPGTWGDWVNCGGWLVINGYHVDLILRDMKRVEQIVKDTEEGIVSCNYQTGHPHGYLSVMYRGELAISKLYYAKNESFNDIKKQAEAYPDALQKGLSEFFMFEAGFSLMLAEKNMAIDDISYICGHCYRSISALNQVIFAINRNYCINEKRAVKMITESFEIKPINYKDRVDRVITLLSTDVESANKSLALLHELVNEVELLNSRENIVR